MSIATESRKQTAYRRAEDQFSRAARRDEQFKDERAKIEAADAAKIARLRALRLAKEQADREAIESGLMPAPAVKAPPKKRRRSINIAP